MAIHIDAGRLLEPATERGQRPPDAGDLGASDAVEDRSKQLVADGIHLVEHAAACVRDADEHDPPVLRDPGPFDEAAFLDPVDQTGRVREGHVEHLRETAHRHLSGPLERVQDVELGHADTEPEEPLARGALQLRHRGAEVGDDGTVRVLCWLAARAPDGGPRVSSCHVNNLSRLNHHVNLND
jgi:hypothetical protein